MVNVQKCSTPTQQEVLYRFGNENIYILHVDVPKFNQAIVTVPKTTLTEKNNINKKKMF